MDGQGMTNDEHAELVAEKVQAAEKNLHEAVHHLQEIAESGAATGHNLGILQAQIVSLGAVRDMVSGGIHPVLAILAAIVFRKRFGGK